MHLSLQTQVALEVGCQVQRDVRRAAACAPSDVYESWLELAQSFNAIVQVRDTGGSFGREKLEGKISAACIFILLQLLTDLHFLN
jgi:hypothetical protein